MKRSFVWYDFLLIALFFYLFILQVQAIWPATIDDMYISLRYAKHWANGYGLVWNINEAPVEGYSNFSFVMLGAVTLFFNFNPVLVLKLAGVVGLFFTCVFIYLLTRFWFDRRVSLLPCVFLLFYYGQIFWALSGLETAVYEALVAASVYFAFKGLGYQLYPNLRGEPRRSSFVLSGILLSLAGLTRPEAPGLMVLFFILICYDQAKSFLRQYWQGVGLFCLMILILYVPYFLWRWHYYGLLFPNPVYCKGISTDLVPTLDLNYLNLIWPFALLAIPVCCLATDKRHYFLWLPSVLYLILLMRADPIVAFYNRLFLPAFVLMLPLALQGINYLIKIYTKKVDELFLFIVTILISLVFIPFMTLDGYREFTQNPRHGEQLRAQVLGWLSRHASSGESVVLGDSGFIPYMSNLRFIDSYCLNNRSMTEYPNKNRYELFCQNILAAKPQYIILTSLTTQSKVIYTPSDACLKNLFNTNSSYHLIKEFKTTSLDSTYRYELYSNRY